MTITPYTTPLQYEYKPLNLLAFAEPLSKMQEQFDLVQAAVDEADFDITHLPYGTDPEKAKELLKTVEGKRDELAKNLLETQNYKQAASKLKDLNTLWKEDPELNALQNNYALFNKLDEAEKKRMDDGKIQRDQYYQWKNRMIRDYETLGGAAFTADYDNPEGTYNPIGRIGRLEDLEKDLQELSWKIASAVPGETREGALQEAGIDISLMDKKFLQETIEEKDATVVAKRVENYLKTLPRFKNWALEVADYNFDELKQDPELFNKTASVLNDEYIASIDDELAAIKKTAKKNPDVLTTPDYLSLLEERDTAVNAKNTGVYDETGIKNLYMQNHLQNVYDMSALGDVFAYKNVKRSYTWRDLHTPDTDSSGGGGSDSDIFGDGFFTESGEVKMDFNTLNETAIKNQNLLNPITTNIAKLAGGAIGRITVGTAGSALYAKVKNRQSSIWDNQQNLLSAITENIAAGGNAKQLLARIKEKGLSATEADAKALMTTFGKGGEAISDYQNLLEQGRSYRDAATRAIQSRDASIKNSTSNSDFANKLSVLGQTAAGSTVMEVYGELKPGGVTYTTDHATGKLTPNPVFITYDSVAQRLGYKNLADAVSKGEMFLGDDVLHGQILKLYGSSSASDKAVVSSYEYVGNAKVDGFVGSLVNSTDDLLRLDPIGYSDWSEVPGFRPGDKNVKLNISGNYKAHLGKVGQDLSLNYPIIYQDEDDTWHYADVKTTLPEGIDPQSLTVLNTLDELSSSNTPGDIQTNQTVKSAKFDQVYGKSSLADNIVQATTVTQGGTPSILFSTTHSPGIEVVIEKTFASGTAFPKLKVALVETSTGNKKYIEEEAGKQWYVDANSTGAGEAAKVVLLKTLE